MLSILNIYDFIIFEAEEHEEEIKAKKSRGENPEFGFNYDVNVGDPNDDSDHENYWI